MAQQTTTSKGDARRKKFSKWLQNSMGTKQTTSAVSENQLKTMAEELERIAQILRETAKTASEQEGGQIGIYNWRTFVVAMGHAAKFAEKCQASRMAAIIGKPYEIGQLKPRAKHPSPKKVAEARKKSRGG